MGQGIGIVKNNAQVVGQSDMEVGGIAYSDRKGGKREMLKGGKRSER